ncbi:MAG TPA: hypothetical protein PKC58_08615 [Ignavibacteria bacterium]|nr:hypothetical protein [Ignavibacteria bacterium]
MNGLKRSAIFTAISFIFMVSVYLSGCNDNNITDNSSMTDDEYIRSLAINTAFSTDADDDENLFASEVFDFDSEGPVSDDPGFDIPMDSVLKWGRRILDVNVNAEITNIGDTIKNVMVTRTVSGNFIVIGYINGILDSTVKPFTQQQRRIINFKRTNRHNNPRLNWRVYEYSAIDGNTTTPQTGKDNIIINKVEFYRNNELVNTLIGPDFTINFFTAGFFGGHNMYEADGGESFKTRVYLTSNQSDTDIVSYHWPRNSNGHHRVRFDLVSETPSGNGFDRVYEKTIEIFNQHRHGRHNAFISANTRSSLFDNDPNLFSSTYLGFPYRVR